MSAINGAVILLGIEGLALLWFAVCCVLWGYPATVSRMAYAMKLHARRVQESRYEEERKVGQQWVQELERGQ